MAAGRRASARAPPGRGFGRVRKCAADPTGMKTIHIACEAPVTHSERLALARIEGGLKAMAGSGEWLLLTNLLFAAGRESRPLEIDIVAIGPPGVRLIEIKHWDAAWFRRQPSLVDRETKKLAMKATLVGSTLRERVLDRLERVEGTMLLTCPDSRTAEVAGQVIHGIAVHGLGDWRGALGCERRPILARREIHALGRCLAPESDVAVDGALRSLGGYRNLELQTPAEQRFHRVFQGIRSATQQRAVLHLYDLSAQERRAETKARREWEALQRLSKRAWSPRVLESFQAAEGYAGELYFFTVVDPAAPSLRERRDDPAWGPQARLELARQAIRALGELHAGAADGERLVHRNLTPATILVRHDNTPILTGFQYARIPSDATVATVRPGTPDWEEAAPPEVRAQGLGAAGPRSDIYSLCFSLSTLFAGRSDEASRRAGALLARGLADRPEARIPLPDLEAAVAALLDEPAPPLAPPPAQYWTEGQVVPFGAKTYRIVDRLGAGGVGIAFRVAPVERSVDERLEDCVAKVIPEAAAGRRALRAHERVRACLRPPLATIQAVAEDWRANSFVALVQWIPGRPLEELGGGLARLARSLGEESAEALALRWLRNACEALDVLHRNGFVHGDVSPRNLIVAEGEIALTDYDCARAIGEAADPPGTVEYCPPPVGEGRLSSAADDLYSLAASFFRVLFDRAPFRRDGDLLKEPGLHWNGADRARYPALATFLARATQADPERRYRSAGEALADLAAPVADPKRAGLPPEKGTARLAPEGSIRDRAERTEPEADGFYVRGRRRFVDWLRRQLIGPARDAEELTVSPLDRYPVGVLHPIEPGASGIDPAAPAGPADPWLDGASEMEELADGAGSRLQQPQRRRRYAPPSSVGFSFFARGAARLAITARAAIYSVEGDRDPIGRFVAPRYRRSELEETTVNWHYGEGERLHLWEGRAEIDVRSKPSRDGAIFTVSLCNRQEVDPESYGRAWADERVAKALCETGLECVVESGELAEFPRTDERLLTEEEQELELQYRSRRIYAVGHGGAVAWDFGADGTGRIRADFLPEVEAPLVTTELPGPARQALELEYLATAPIQETAAELRRFAAGYEAWIDEQSLAGLRGGERAAAQRIQGRMAVALERMQAGIALLQADGLVAAAFRLANQAMLDQMRRYDQLAGRGEPAAAYRWRPFQLAFLLTVLASTVRSDDLRRDVLDLIWFPTGGGKTEAYLGLIAFLIAWRRLQHPEASAGTAVLMRYTLRLLTRQQFERATRIVFALELLRRRQPGQLGAEPVTAGIWVGQAICPNTFRAALEIKRKIAAGESPANALMLAECPWCGAGFDASSIHAAKTRFELHCLNRSCEFGAAADPLPVNFVDEALYARPPSLLIGTLDKFARLAWDGRTGAFFGGRSNRPPELVIQDELHLVTGPLGSVAGLYETALDTVIRVRGLRPKYIASTATTRMAAEQVRRLYGRELAVFPPPGLSCDDCYFARADRKRPGRLYVGYLAPMLNARLSLAPLAAALLCGPLEVFAQEAEADREALLEAWWTQIVYNSTLNGVAHAHNAYTTEVRRWARSLLGEILEADPGPGSEGPEAAFAHPSGAAPRARVQDTAIAQLASTVGAQQNAETFRRLARRREEEDHLDVVLATNMISVGVDVSRLALMLVNGQPLTTAEYIQASSRVGRSEVPGLVVANYFRHQSRSLSRYELFRAFHESFYRFVEPASVTPYTFPVRARALHAALVIAVRHANPALRENSAAGAFDPDNPLTRRAIECLKRRCGLAEPPDRAGETSRHLDELVEQWRLEAIRCRNQRRALHYEARDRGSNSLLRADRDRKPGLWPTLHSMRHVERSGVLNQT